MVRIRCARYSFVFLHFTHTQNNAITHTHKAQEMNNNRFFLMVFYYGIKDRYGLGDILLNFVLGATETDAPAGKEIFGETETILS